MLRKKSTPGATVNTANTVSPEKNATAANTALTPEERADAKRIRKRLRRIQKFLSGYKKRRKKIGKYKKKIGLIRIAKLSKIKKIGKGKAVKRQK